MPSPSLPRPHRDPSAASTTNDTTPRRWSTPGCWRMARKSVATLWSERTPNGPRTPRAPTKLLGATAGSLPCSGMFPVPDKGSRSGSLGP
eukprot:4330071-Alexandrium_andersonii.AAC.1